MSHGVDSFGVDFGNGIRQQRYAAYLDLGGIVKNTAMSILTNSGMSPTQANPLVMNALNVISMALAATTESSKDWTLTKMMPSSDIPAMKSAMSAVDNVLVGTLIAKNILCVGGVFDGSYKCVRPLDATAIKNYAKTNLTNWSLLPPVPATDYYTYIREGYNARPLDATSSNIDMMIDTLITMCAAYKSNGTPILIPVQFTSNYAGMPMDIANELQNGATTGNLVGIGRSIAKYIQACAVRYGKFDGRTCNWIDWMAVYFETIVAMDTTYKNNDNARMAIQKFTKDMFTSGIAYNKGNTTVTIPDGLKTAIDSRDQSATINAINSIAVSWYEGSGAADCINNAWSSYYGMNTQSWDGTKCVKIAPIPQPGSPADIAVCKASGGTPEGEGPAMKCISYKEMCARNGGVVVQELVPMSGGGHTSVAKCYTPDEICTKFVEGQIAAKIASKSFTDAEYYSMRDAIVSAYAQVEISKQSVLSKFVYYPKAKRLELVSDYAMRMLTNRREFQVGNLAIQLPDLMDKIQISASAGQATVLDPNVQCQLGGTDAPMSQICPGIKCGSGYTITSDWNVFADALYQVLIDLENISIDQASLQADCESRLMKWDPDYPVGKRCLYPGPSAVDACKAKGGYWKQNADGTSVGCVAPPTCDTGSFWSPGEQKCIATSSCQLGTAWDEPNRQCYPLPIAQQVPLFTEQIIKTAGCVYEGNRKEMANTLLGYAKAKNIDGLRNYLIPILSAAMGDAGIPAAQQYAANVVSIYWAETDATGLANGKGLANLIGEIIDKKYPFKGGCMSESGCPSGKLWSSVSGTCVDADTNTCPTGYLWDGTNCVLNDSVGAGGGMGKVLLVGLGVLLIGGVIVAVVISKKKSKTVSMSAPKEYEPIIMGKED